MKIFVHSTSARGFNLTGLVRPVRFVNELLLQDTSDHKEALGVVMLERVFVS